VQGPKSPAPEAAVVPYGEAYGAVAAGQPGQPAPEGFDPTTGLPLGWIWQQDQSGNVYYVNTISGVTQWEPPQPPVVAAPAPVAAPAAPAAQPASYAEQPVAAAPRAAAQGHHATPQPGVPRLDGFKSGPGKKSEAYVPQQEAGADFGAAADPAAVPEHLQAIVPLLSDLQAQLAGACVAAAEKKQLAEVAKAASILIGKLGCPGAVSGEVAAKALALVVAVASRDYPLAGSIHKDLTTSAWDEHKDWVKGIKGLVGLAQKKF
jgi:hypothetical protein